MITAMRLFLTPLFLRPVPSTTLQSHRAVTTIKTIVSLVCSVEMIGWSSKFAAVKGRELEDQFFRSDLSCIIQGEKTWHLLPSFHAAAVSGDGPSSTCAWFMGCATREYDVVSWLVH